MKKTFALLSLAVVCFVGTAVCQNDHQNHIKRVLLISGANHGDPYCPALAALAKHGVNYVNASTSKPSDSFPGLTAIVTGGSPAFTGGYYDVAYSRKYDAPEVTTGNGLAGGSCSQNGTPTGTTTEYEEGIDFDKTKLNGGAPGASFTDGGISSID